MPDVIADSNSFYHIRLLSAGKGLLIAAGLLLTLAVALLLIFKPTPIQQAELALYDLMLIDRRIPQQSGVPVLVGIDEESLAAFGQWPWPRYRLAMLVDRLQQLGAEVIALDILMSEPDRSSPEVIRAERKRDHIEADASASTGDQDSNSQRLAATMGQGKTVLAYQLDFSGTSAFTKQQPAPAAPEGMVLTSSPGSTDGWPKPTGVIRNLPLLTAAASAEGFSNTIRDIDGILRRTPLLLSLEGQNLPSFAMTAILLASPERTLSLVKDGEETFLQWANRRIPLDQTGNMLLDFRSEHQSFPYYSARTILNGTVEPGSLRGKIVLVGAWASGMGDSHLSPSGRWMNGLEVNATIVDNVLTGKFIARPGWARGVELFAILLLGVASTLLLSRSGFRLALVVVILGSVGCYWGGQQLLVTTGLYLSPLLPMLTPVIITIFLSLLKYRNEARREEKINELAFFDPLTGLPNRTLLLDRLRQLMTTSTRDDSYAALLFINLDNFKTINDTLGHDMGDLLLKQAAQRLTMCVPEGDTVARLGGDEFVLALGGLGLNESEAAMGAEIVARKALAALNQAYLLGDGSHRCTASVGATLFKGDLSSIEDLMKQANLAMYKSKAAGRNAFSFFDPDMEAAVMNRAALEKDLRVAVEEKQFLLYYQAQVVGEGRLTGAEVLLRWQHPQRGIVSPAEFIPLAEETGLILPLGLWVLETACTQLAIWADRAEMAHLTVAVNVSAHQFSQDDFVNQVLAVLKRTGANPQRLKLELTESLLVGDVQNIIEKMLALKAKGVSFSLDDFGTGYSSLSYLKRLPLEQLKIDQSFVRDVLNDPNDAAIVSAIVALAQSLGLGVIAEGVETAAQRDCLANLGCHTYQGYFFSRPLPLEGFEAFARQV